MIAVLDEPIDHAYWNAVTLSRGMDGNGLVTGTKPTGTKPTGTKPLEGWEAIAKEIAGMQHLGEDWDGLGGRSPSRELLDSALGLAYILQEKGTVPPSAVTASTSGSIVLVWQGPGETYCEVELTRPFYGEVMIVEPGKEPEYFEIPNA